MPRLLVFLCSQSPSPLSRPSCSKQEYEAKTRCSNCFPECRTETHSAFKGYVDVYNQVYLLLSLDRSSVSTDLGVGLWRGLHKPSLDFIDGSRGGIKQVWAHPPSLGAEKSAVSFDTNSKTFQPSPRNGDTILTDSVCPPICPDKLIGEPIACAIEDDIVFLYSLTHAHGLRPEPGS